MKIIIDTREQQAWHFPEHLASVERGKINAGDYALAGDSEFAIERKSLDDFVGTISTGWERFQKEIERMKALKYPANVIIVEASIDEIFKHKYNHPKVSPAFVIKQIAVLTMQQVSILFCDNPISAAGLCFSLLKIRKNTIERQPNNNC